MKLTIERAALLQSLGHVQSVVERRTTIPILSNVLLECEPAPADGPGADTLRLSATDMDLAIVDEAPAQVELPGALTAPALMLYDIVRKLPEGSQVELVSDGDSGRLALRAGRARFALQTLPKEDFPVMAAGDLPYRFELPAADLRALIDRTKFAISTEETRYYLNGIYLHAMQQDGVAVLRAVATDGHRLARVEMPLPDGADGMPGVIVPRKAVGEVRRLAEETSAPVAVGLSDTKIQFAVDNVVLTSKLIDGTFPQYERVIPTGNDKVMEVDRLSFAQAVDRVATISTEKSRAVRLRLNPGSLTLSATSPESGTATEELEIGYSADPIEIGFNARYLLDIAQQIEGEGAQFVMSDDGSPTIVRDAADASALYVLMPMRV
jgi:DNA polymerase-3 subunit beta